MALKITSFNMVSIVVPIFQASQSINELNLQLNNFLNNKKYNYEIIYVDDYSNDSSWQKIKEIANSNFYVKGIKLKKNYGQHNSLLCGIRNAKGDIIATMDDDLQNPPEELEKMLNKINEGYDVVYGSSFKYKRSVWRNCTSLFTKKILKQIIGSEFTTKISDFRVFRTNLRETFADFKSPDVNIDVLLSWATENYSYVDTIHDQRKHNKSNYSLKKLILYGITMVTGFSTFPLKLASILGLFFSLIGFIILLYVLIDFLISGSPVAGFPFIASTIAIFSGIQLFILGIMGEYISKIHQKTMTKPSYSIQEITDVIKNKNK